MCKSIPGVKCAHFLGKMVEIVSIKGERLQFHSHSTSVVDLMVKSSLNQSFRKDP
jgi:hypothetical protein